MSLVTLIYLIVLVLWWHATPWLIRIALLKVLPPILGKIMREVKTHIGSN